MIWPLPVVSFPVVQRMIGGIVLRTGKNAQFSLTRKVLYRNVRHLRKSSTEELAGKRVQDSLSSNPVLTMMNSLEREKTQREYMLGKELQSRKDLAEWNAKNLAKIPVLTGELRKKIGEMGGGSVQLQIDDSIPVRE
jgi:hypothetical protein